MPTSDKVPLLNRYRKIGKIFCNDFPCKFLICRSLEKSHNFDPFGQTEQPRFHLMILDGMETLLKFLHLGKQIVESDMFPVYH